MAFRAAVEVDLDCDVPALMDVYMVMPAQLKDFDGQQNVNWGVLVDTVLDLIWLGQRLLAFADKYQHVVLTFLQEADTDQHVFENLVRGCWYYLRFTALGVDEQL